ncbi:hypothetical protein GE061_011526, partial [Apolygus lucorum]
SESVERIEGRSKKDFKMMQQYMKELEQEPFDPQEFVERLAWRTIDTDNGASNFEPSLMF